MNFLGSPLVTRPPLTLNRFVYPSTTLAAVKHELIEQIPRLASLPLARRGKTILRLETPLADCAPLEWLSWQNAATQVYWSGRQRDLEIAGIGCADRIHVQRGQDYAALLSDLEERLKHCPHVRYYGGVKFNPSTPLDEAWRAHGVCWFVLPRFEVMATATGTCFVCNIVLDPARSLSHTLRAVVSELERVKIRGAEPSDRPRAKLLSRRDLPDKPHWLRAIGTALAALETGKLAKIVVGRDTLLTFDGPPDALAVLSRLKAIEPSAYHFCMQPAPGWSFVGATPERLYQRLGDLIQSEAVAGTCPRGADPADDEAKGAALLDSDKDRREHVAVRDHVEAILARHCDSLDVNPAVRLLKQSKVQHLYSQIDGRLATDIANSDLLRLLHPTPAVAGLPRGPVLEAIARLEPFDRGWFAGPIGWLSGDGAEFAVGIRSGLVNGGRVRLFAGAGVVPGSVPELEWAEVESKIGVFLEALGVG